MKYVWDPEKAEKNLKKHSISFGEATLVFEDRYGLELFDEIHSTFGEKRFIRIGISSDKLLNVVYSVWDESNEVHRIITARKATAFEQRLYWEERHEE